MKNILKNPIHLIYINTFILYTRSLNKLVCFFSANIFITIFVFCRSTFGVGTELVTTTTKNFNL